MSYDRLDDEDMPGYFLREESQFRLAKLRDHVRFLVRMAQPRTQAEERAAEPKVRMGELALCLELLAEQVDLVLDALSYPAQRAGTTRGAWSDATIQAAPDAGSGPFRVTQQQIDRLTQLADTVSANARMVAAGDTAERAGQTMPEVGSTLCAAASEVHELLLQIGSHPLREPASNRVREERAVYALEFEAAPAAGRLIH
ncbi:hypothetical protein [uncultured Xanthomonas sp.]|uniref:XAC0095 family protein n=1 Tax=uncultured Xanthomonas sp. TaxID=152831 RepID=UPI0025D6DB79|nr:hypothetical protein [uncultured Xanthomonas sp.]